MFRCPVNVAVTIHSHSQLQRSCSGFCKRKKQNHIYWGRELTYILNLWDDHLPIFFIWSSPYPKAATTDVASIRKEWIPNFHPTRPAFCSPWEVTVQNWYCVMVKVSLWQNKSPSTSPLNWTNLDSAFTGQSLVTEQGPRLITCSLPVSYTHLTLPTKA